MVLTVIAAALLDLCVAITPIDPPLSAHGDRVGLIRVGGGVGYGRCRRTGR